MAIVKPTLQPISTNQLPNQYALQRAATNVAETFPRWACVNRLVIVAGVVYLTRITLEPQAYTTVTMWVPTQQGVTLANTFFGLYDTATNHRQAVSADVSTAVAAITADSIGTLTLNYTAAAEADYWLAFLVGSAVTKPDVPIAISVSGSSAIYTPTPVLCAVDTTTGATALPSTVTPSQTAAQPRPIWFRYS